MKLSVQKRTVIGKKTRILRKDSLVPGVVYGKHMSESLPLVFDRVKLVKAIQKAGKNTPVELTGDGIDELILFNEIQLDPVTDQVIHIDCLAVNKNEKVTAEVPVVLVGVSPFEKDGLGSIQLLRNKLEVEALPLNLPQDIKVDISSITEDGMAIHLSDITVGKDITLLGDGELTILSTEAFKEEIVEETEEELDTDEENVDKKE